MTGRPTMEDAAVRLLKAAGPAAIAAWEDFVAAPTLQASTRNLYRQTAQRFLRCLEPQGIRLIETTAPVVERFLDSLNVSPESKRLYRTCLRRFFDALTARKVMSANPAGNIQYDRDDPTVGAHAAAAEGDEPLPSLDELKAIVRELDPAAIDDNPEMLDAGLVLLAGAYLGTGKIVRVSRFTGVHPQRVAKFARRLRANGVWTPDGKTAADWDEFPVSLVIDILIAVGMVECGPGPKGEESPATAGLYATGDEP